MIPNAHIQSWAVPSTHFSFKIATELARYHQGAVPKHLVLNSVLRKMSMPGGSPIPAAVIFCSFWVFFRTVDLGFDPLTSPSDKHSHVCCIWLPAADFWRPRFCHGKGLQGLKGLKAQAAMRCPLADGGCGLGWQMATGSRDLALSITADFAVHESFISHKWCPVSIVCSKTLGLEWILRSIHNS